MDKAVYSEDHRDDNHQDLRHGVPVVHDVVFESGDAKANAVELTLFKHPADFD